MGGREALTMETNENLSFKREKGCFLSAFAILLLMVAFTMVVVATGLLVYFFTDKPAWMDDQEAKPEYQIINQQSHDNRHDHHKMHDKEMANKDKTMMDDKSEKKKKVMDVRLPRSIMPLHYHVKLQPFINGNFTIHGYVEMTFKVLEMTKNVTLHINGIVTTNDTIKVMSAEGGDKIPVMKHEYDVDRQFYIAHLKMDLKPDMMYKISMNYVGVLNDNMNGVYKSSYTDKQGTKKWLAATQFQATDARKAFPCLDEPALKANFTIELAREEGMTSISNMPQVMTVPVEGQPGWFWDKFMPSVPMSTYLVAFVISDFKHIQSVDDNKYNFTVFARPEALSQLNYSLKVGPAGSKFFEGYFNVSFPLPKQDMIALPDFSAGAMENWGLITYRETAMLFDETISRAVDKFYVGSVIIHELAHQWFGNLVTPSWWTDLWLNEGFASYMEYVGLDAVEPSFKVNEQFVLNDLQPVFALDCLESSHPINIEVRHPDEIGEIFDKISYSKGASIIRMMNLFLGEETFRTGLSKYLKAKAYSDAVQDDLWKFLTEQAHMDKSMDADMNIKTIMDTWTLQMGFPVITVENKRDGTAILKQERFLLVKNSNSTDTHDYKWWVPINYATDSNPDFLNTKPKLWMKPSEGYKIVTDIAPSSKWVIFNIQQAGYFRVNYDIKNWESIIEQLLTDHTVIGTINRAQIIDDSMVLARAGLLPYEIPLKIMSYLKNEEEYVPWQTALNNLSFIKSMFAHTGACGAYEEFLLSLTTAAYEKLGFTDSASHPHLEQRKRSSILRRVCSLDYKKCVDESVNLFKKWMQDPENKTIISPNLKNMVYCTGIKKGGYKEWKFAWDRYLKANVAAEKRILMSAMGCTKESWIQGGYLQRALTPGKGIRKQDAASVIGSIANTDHGRIVAWEFLKDRWNDLYELFGKGSFTLDRIVKSVTSSLNTRNHLKELITFQEENKEKLGTAERAIKQSIENLKNNINWMDNHYKTILTWLTENGYVNSI